MASNEVRSRPSIIPTSTPPLLGFDPDHPNPSNRNPHFEFRLLYPFSIPSSPEAAAVRVVQNLVYFALFYTFVLLIGLSISLIPERKLSLLLLVATSSVTCSYLLLLRMLPSSSLLHRIVDRRIVLLLVAVVTTVELILTKAGVHLGATLAIGVPVVLVHALFRTRDDLVVKEEAWSPGELFFLVVNKKLSDHDELETVV